MNQIIKADRRYLYACYARSIAADDDFQILTNSSKIKGDLLSACSPTPFYPLIMHLFKPCYMEFLSTLIKSIFLNIYIPITTARILFINDIKNQSI